MFSLNLFRQHRDRLFVDLRTCCLPLLLAAIAVGWGVPSSLKADEPPADVPSSASAGSAVEVANAEKIAATPAIANATSTAESTAAAADGSQIPAESSAKMPAKRRGNAARLPAYYGTVVDDQQRAAIYEIRARVEAQLQQLQQQIDTIRQAEQAEMEAVLTAEQLQRIETLRAQRVKSAKPAKASTPRQPEAS